MIRTIEMWCHTDFTDIQADNRVSVDACIGYLVSWALHSERYCRLSIYGDSQGNLNATYRNSAGEVTYTMFGLCDTNGTFSTHS